VDNGIALRGEIDQRHAAQVDLADEGDADHDDRLHVADSPRQCMKCQESRGRRGFEERQASGSEPNGGTDRGTILDPTSKKSKNIFAAQISESGFFTARQCMSRDGLQLAFKLLIVHYPSPKWTALPPKADL
jgi:hypothetical protein